ncbi:MAG: alpha/beta fold hydrolase [Leptospirales bacterium]|nr:alpha/beta fold hydrolase [Leptospirales bacterium]
MTEQRLLHSIDHGGHGAPLVILHGLFGSSRNWTQAARVLNQAAHVFALDLRNHGESFSSPIHTIAEMRGDLLRWMDAQQLQQAMVLGHSMGGMNAMDFAAAYPDRVLGLIVVDIAPRAYAPHHQREFAALRTDLSGLQSRQEIDRRMAAAHPDAAVRQFLQMNLERTAEGYRWKLNVDALQRAEITGQFSLPRPAYGGPALFIAGGASSYVQPADHALIQSCFPAANIETIAGADHWLHHSAQQQFLELSLPFLQALNR